VLLHYYFRNRTDLKGKYVTEAWTLTEASFLKLEEVSLLLQRIRERERAESSHPVFLTDRLIVEGLLFSGLRNTEFCSLALGNTVVGRKQSIFVVAGTPKQDRVVHVPDFVSDLVKRYAKEVRPGLLREEFSPDDPAVPLLLNERGRPYERTALYRRVLRILADVGFGARASVQLLRHTYGFLAYKQTGGNLLFVQQQLGHAHPMVTAVYADFVPFPPEELVATTAAMFQPSAESTPRRRKRAARRAVAE